MRIYGLASFAMACGAVIALSACDASTPSQVYTGKIRIREQIVTENLDAGRIDPARLDQVAEGVLSRGRGRVTLTVPYPAGDDVGEKAARKQGMAYKKALAGRGVRDVSVAMIPVTDRAQADRIVLDYPAVAAVPAAGCKRITGYQGAETVDVADEYKYGCEMQAIISRMVADPSDLLGKAGTPDEDSQRSGTIIDKHKAGVPNEKMQGMQASTVGTGG